MNTVTVCAYNRPEYLNAVLHSLSAACALAPDFNLKVFVGIDPGGDRQGEVTAVAKRWLCDPSESLIVWPERLGVNEHPRRILQFVFTEASSSFNIHLEDDTVLSPDAIRLCQWYRRQTYDHVIRDRCWLSLHSPHKQYLPSKGDSPSLIVPRKDFGVWGWACWEHAWSFWMSPYWNHRRTHPIGWDWSLSDNMRNLGLRAVAPALSRVHNIGREGGVYQTPEGYDEEMKDAKWATGSDIQTLEDFHYAATENP